ncbi:MAG TPA: VOC family protein [Bacteroidia bacterium]|jgi:predicted enzyme related to lactoylglutathione lyase
MHADANALNWFEIPVSDFERAKKFYETIFGISIQKQAMGPFTMGFLPMYDGKISGALCHGAEYKPSADGTLVYLNANPDMNAVLSKIERSGGKILRPKTEITPEYGFMALFIDSEGNRVALHSNK